MRSDFVRMEPPAKWAPPDKLEATETLWRCSLDGEDVHLRVRIERVMVEFGEPSLKPSAAWTDENWFVKKAADNETLLISFTTAPSTINPDNKYGGITEEQVIENCISGMLNRIRLYKRYPLVPQNNTIKAATPPPTALLASVPRED